MNLGYMEWEVVDWIHLAQDRIQLPALVNCHEPLGSMKGGGDFLAGMRLLASREGFFLIYKVGWLVGWLVGKVMPAIVHGPVPVLSTSQLHNGFP
jgi:hypothetical protein